MAGRSLKPYIYGLLASGVALAAAMDAAGGEGEAQVLRSAGGYSAGRPASELREIGALEEIRIAPDERVTRAKGIDSHTSSALPADHWLYDAGVELFFDADDDGYYRYVRVSFDVDSYYHQAWVYAELYLSGDGELWELYHATEDFRVDGATADDAYEVETELVTGYPAGLYDLLIEIYDADTGEFMDELGPVQSSAFALLPLEDSSYDQLPPPVVVSHGHGGGSMGWLSLLWLGAAVVAARRTHLGLRRAAPRRIPFDP